MKWAFLPAAGHLAILPPAPPSQLSQLLRSRTMRVERIPDEVGISTSRWAPSNSYPNSSKPAVEVREWRGSGHP